MHANRVVKGKQNVTERDRLAGGVYIPVTHVITGLGRVGGSASE
jgi:hypothetical protein